MAKTYYLPTVAAVAVASFTPAGRPGQNDENDDLIAVEYLDYGIVSGLQITSLAYGPITIERVIVNSEFRPSLHALREGGPYLCIGFPRCLRKFGDSFFTLTHAPAAEEPIRSLCYGEPIRRLSVATGAGEFSFEIGETVRDMVLSPLV